MEEKKVIIKPAELCRLLKEFCEKKGLVAHENKFGVTGKMVDGTELFIYSVPKKVVGQNPSFLLYGQTYRSDKRMRYLTKDAARILYGKLKKGIEQ